MDENLDKLKQHLDYLTQELERLKKERNKVEREISLAENSLKNGQALYNSLSGAYPEVEPSPGKYDGMTQVAAARRFLAEHDNKPYHAREFYAELSANGVKFKGKEPVWALATNLSLHKDFEPTGERKATFRLKDKAYQEELEEIKKEAMEGKFPGFNNMVKASSQK